MCRDLSSYLSCRPRTLSPNVRNWTVELSDNGNMQGDALELLTAMTFMKLQICYFGNMALRSSLAFALVGSLLVGVIPIIIEHDN